MTILLCACSEGVEPFGAGREISDEGLPVVVWAHVPRKGPEQQADAIALELAARSPAPGQGDLDFEYAHLDIGATYQQSRYEAVFPFTVQGNSPVVVTELYSSCGCTAEAWIRPAWMGLADTKARWPLNHPIPAGASGSVVVIFDTGLYEGDKDALITLHGDFLSQEVSLEVTSFIVPTFEVEPGIVELGVAPLSHFYEVCSPQIFHVKATREFQVIGWGGLPPGVAVREVDCQGDSHDGASTRCFCLVVGSEIEHGVWAALVTGQTDIAVSFDLLIRANILDAPADGMDVSTVPAENP